MGDSAGPGHAHGMCGAGFASRSKRARGLASAASIDARHCGGGIPAASGPALSCRRLGLSGIYRLFPLTSTTAGSNAQDSQKGWVGFIVVQGHRVARQMGFKGGGPGNSDRNRMTNGLEQNEGRKGEDGREKRRQCWLGSKGVR